MIAGALTGVRVVELAEGVAGPLAARLLGDAGADVIKVETPDGDRAAGGSPEVDGMGAVFGTLNRNKRSIAVDPIGARGDRRARGAGRRPDRRSRPRRRDVGGPRGDHGGEPRRSSCA